MEHNPGSNGRRDFIGSIAAITTLSAFNSINMFTSCKSSVNKFEMPQLPDKAPDGPMLKAGLIGCGSRGTGAAFNFIDAGPNLQITALADVFQDRIDSCRKALKEQRGVEIPDKNCHVGFDAYKNVIESDVDVILEASLAYCRPAHFAAAVQARKHVFLEKPAGVDPVGVRSVMASGRMAESAGLSVVAGTQRRHQLDHIATFNMVKSGAIGNLISARCFYNIGDPPFLRRQEGWSDMEAMIRNRGNWCWLTGDAIVNLLVHNIDNLNWFFGKHPAKATGYGGRHRRQSGDMYDFFSVDFVFDDNRHYHGMCRQIDGCTQNVGQVLWGSQGYTNCQNQIFDREGRLIWEFDYPKGEDGRSTGRVAVSPYDQEIINLVTAIRTEIPVNETQELATSTLTGIMGRESAYTGKDITWEEMMSSGLQLGPKEYQMGPVDIKPLSPVPGIPPNV